MSSVVEIEEAIRKLPESDFWKLSQWFDEVRDEAWSARMEADAEAGRLDFLFDEASEARELGAPRDWPAKR